MHTKEAEKQYQQKLSFRLFNTTLQQQNKKDILYNKKNLIKISLKSNITFSNNIKIFNIFKIIRITECYNFKFNKYFWNYKQ